MIVFPSRRLRCPSEIAAASAAIEERGCERDRADAQALTENGFASWHALAAAHAMSIETAIGGLPLPCDAAGARLLEGTRRFLKSDSWLQCVSLDWSLGDVFGLDGWSPLERRELLGLVPSAAFAPKVGRKLLDISAAGAEFQDPDGCLKRFRRPSLIAPDAGDAVLWWQAEALINAEAA